MSADLYARPRIDEPDVQSLLAELGVDPGTVSDLGGTMSLNLHVPAQDIVVRMHARFVTRARVEALQDLRGELSERGLVVGRPVPVAGALLVERGGRLVEAERYVANTKPDPTWPSYRWMYAAMGALHAALGDLGRGMPAPVVATYGTPDVLRIEAGTTAAAVAHDPDAAETVARVHRLLERLDEQWIEPARLPDRVVHGDIRLGNVVLSSMDEAAYFDFGFAAVRPRIHELAYSLLWIVLRPDASGRPEDFDWSAVDELVAEYETAAGDPLSPLERHALGPYLAAVPIYLSAVASHTPDPIALLRGERPLLDIAEWVLLHRPFGSA